MSLYVDSSAVLKLYISEVGSSQVRTLLAQAEPVVTARLTIVEVRRNLARMASPVEHRMSRAAFDADMETFAIVELDSTTCDIAADIAERLGVRSLDSLHLAAAVRAIGPGGDMLTFDVRQAQAARALGLRTVGA